MKSLLNKKYFNKITIKAVILAGIFVLSFLLVFQRIKSERKNNDVEICLSFEEVYDLCFVNNYDFVDFLKRAQAIGVTSVSISEEPLYSLENSGKLIFYSIGEYKRLQLLDVLTAYGKINNDTMVFQDNDLAEKIQGQLTGRYGFNVTADKAGKNKVLNLKFKSSYRPSSFSGNIMLGFSDEKIKQLKDIGFKVVLRPQNFGDPGWIFEKLPEDLSGFLWDGKEIPGYPGKENGTLDNLKNRGIKYVDLEFSKIGGEEALKRSNPAQMISGHVILLEELNVEQNLDNNVQRWVRAVRERGNRFLYFHFFKNKTIEDNIAYLRSTAWKLKQKGFNLGSASPPDYPMGKLIKTRKLMIFVIAVFFPVFALYKGSKFSNPLVSYSAVNLITLSGGFLIAAFLYDLAFMQRIILPLSIKLSIAIPLLVSVFVLYRIDELKAFLKARIEVKHILLAFAGLLILILMFLRSGNYHAVYPFESKARLLLENLLIVRPRTKEFLFGQPLLFAGFYFKKRYLILLGMIGQVSLINTFLHAHTPVLTSLIRVFHGAWIGLFAGFILIAMIELVKNTRFVEKE